MGFAEVDEALEEKDKSELIPQQTGSVSPSINSHTVASDRGNKENGISEMEKMKERFCKLLLGEDMSGGGKGVSSALAVSNAITNLAASVFGEQRKLEPMDPERKARWKREIDWFLSITDYIVEFVPCQQKLTDETTIEVMMVQQRMDLHMNIPALRKLDVMLVDALDNFKDEQEYSYVSRSASESPMNGKWWLPNVKVPPNGLSKATRLFLQKQKEVVNQVLKASMAINAQILSDIEIPDSYIETLPKNGRDSLGEAIYGVITSDSFDPMQFLSTMDLSSDLNVLDLKDRIEASIVIWTRKLRHRDARTVWISSVRLEKRKLFEERVQTVLLLLKQRFPGIPQSTLEISKIQCNQDVGFSIMESYSRVLETMASTVLSRIKDVLHADSLAQTVAHTPSPMISNPRNKEGTPSFASPVSLSDFMGWDIDTHENHNVKKVEHIVKDEEEKITSKPARIDTKKMLFVDKIEMSISRSPTARH